MENKIVVRVSIWDHTIRDGEVGNLEYDREQLKASDTRRKSLAYLVAKMAKEQLKKMGLEQ